MLKKPDLNKPAFIIFPHMKEHIENNECAVCGQEIKEFDFKDELNKQEYSVSGICQQCQNKVFS